MPEKKLIHNRHDPRGFVEPNLVIERQGIMIDQRFDEAGQCSYPAFSEHLICINLPQIVLIEQVLQGKLNPTTFVKGNLSILPAGTPVP